MKIFYFFTIFLIMQQKIQGQLMSNSKCQSKPIEKNFDISKYAGKWYEISRYEQPYTFGCVCVEATYTIHKSGDVGVKNCCSRNGSPNCLLATALVSYPDQNPLEGRLNVSFFGVEKPSNYWVMKTDYINFAIVYFCEPLLMDKSKESFWLLSRTKTLSSDVSAIVEESIDKYFIRTNSVFITADPNERCPEME